MDNLTISAASGLRARLESLDLLANNLANAETGGYKTDREFYNLYVSADAGPSEDGRMVTLPVVESSWTDFSQGTLRPTGSPLDLAISGKGFFAVDGPSGNLYTRNGNFRVSPAGTLVTGEGYAVRTAAGTRLQVPPGGTLEIDPDGTVRQNGNTLGKLAIADFDDVSALAKQGTSYFRSSAAARPADSARIEQGKLENANVSAAESAIRLVSVMRQYEMLQKAAALGSQMNREAVEEVARVAS